MFFNYDRVVIYTRLLCLSIFLLVVFESTVRNVFLSGQDFRSFYIAGQILLEGNNEYLYQPEMQKIYQERLGFTEANGWPLALFLNPPVYALLMKPFSIIPYYWSLFIWRLLSIAILVLVIIKVIKYLNLNLKWGDLIVIIMASLPGFIVVVNGQNSFIFLSIYAGSYILFMQEREYLSGLLLGVGLLKPQLVLFIPLLFMFQKKFRFILGFTTTTLIIISISIFVIGFTEIESYLNLFNSDEYIWFMNWRAIDMHSISPFFSLLFGIGLSNLISILSATILFTATILFLTDNKIILTEKELFCIGIIGSLLSSPHLFHYDLTILILPFLLMYSWMEKTYNESGKFIKLRLIDRNIKLLMVCLFVVLWVNALTIDIVKIQFSVIIMLLILIFTLNRARFIRYYYVP